MGRAGDTDSDVFNGVAAGLVKTVGSVDGLDSVQTEAANPIVGGFAGTAGSAAVYGNNGCEIRSAGCGIDCAAAVCCAPCYGMPAESKEFRLTQNTFQINVNVGIAEKTAVPMCLIEIKSDFNNYL